MDTNAITQQKLDTLKSDLEGVKQSVAGLPTFIQQTTAAARAAQSAGDDQALNDQLDALDATARELASSLGALQAVTGTTPASTPATPTA